MNKSEILRWGKGTKKLQERKREIGGVRRLLRGWCCFVATEDHRLGWVLVSLDDDDLKSNELD